MAAAASVTVLEVAAAAAVIICDEAAVSPTPTTSAQCHSVGSRVALGTVTTNTWASLKGNTYLTQQQQQQWQQAAAVSSSN